MSDNINQDIAISGEGNIVVGKGDVIINPLPPAEARLRHDLGVLLKNVETTWIKGVLEKSVHEAALLDLGMEVREDVVENPWRMLMEGPNQPSEILPRGKKINDVLYEANGLLLILGEPGSGKTTTLLQLARALIADIDQTFTQPVPVILNLSTWTNRQQTIDEWLVAELNSKYRLPKKDGRRWLQERRILPLLDGLDEVKPEIRAACVEKINEFVRDYGLQGLVVCSRIKDYIGLDVRLAFYRAIHIQPLTNEQIDEYLDRAGDKLSSLHTALQTDESLRVLASSPLILNIMSLAYQNTSAQALINPSLSTNQDRRRHLFDAYIARMFNRKVWKQEYDDRQTRLRLSWLARNMQRHNQEVFLIESLQPSWLLKPDSMLIYFLISRFMNVLTAGVSLLGFELLVQSEIVPVTWPIFGLALGVTDLMRFNWLTKWKGMKKLPVFWWTIINFVIVCLISGLIFGTDAGIVVAAFYGLIFGLRASRQSSETDIETVESLLWSWRSAANGGLVSAIVGLIIGVVYWMSLGLGLIGRKSCMSFGTFTTCQPFIIIATIGLVFALFAGLIGLIFRGFRSEIVQTKSTPNEGIRLSIKSAIIAGLSLGVITALAAGLILALNAEDMVGFFSAMGYGLLFGMPFGLLGVLLNGGFDTIQHYVLRLVLLVQAYTSLKYAHFLDYAADRIFLQKVGGGYRFIHRLLLEHFANMDETIKV